MGDSNKLTIKVKRKLQHQRFVSTQTETSNLILCHNDCIISVLFYLPNVTPEFIAVSYKKGVHP